MAKFEMFRNQENSESFSAHDTIFSKGDPRTVARTDCKLVPIDQKRFQFLVQQTPYFAIEVMRVLVERLRRADRLVEA